MAGCTMVTEQAAAVADCLEDCREQAEDTVAGVSWDATDFWDATQERPGRAVTREKFNVVPTAGDLSAPATLKTLKPFEHVRKRIHGPYNRRYRSCDR